MTKFPGQFTRILITVCASVAIPISGKCWLIGTIYHQLSKRSLRLILRPALLRTRPEVNWLMGPEGCLMTSIGC